MWACDGYLLDVFPGLVAIPNPPYPPQPSLFFGPEMPALRLENGGYALRENGGRLLISPKVTTQSGPVTDSNGNTLADNNLNSLQFFEQQS